MTIKSRLPRQAFAIQGDYHNHETWKLHHHTRDISAEIKSGRDNEDSVDWTLAAAAVEALRRREVKAPPETILSAARHLAEHYRTAGKPIPPYLSAIM